MRPINPTLPEGTVSAQDGLPALIIPEAPNEA